MSLRRRHSRPAVAAGFTLIELMLAVAILGLIMVMLAGSFHAVATGKLQGENRLVTAQQGRSVLWQMSNEIRGAVQTQNVTASNVSLIGQGRMQNNSPLDSISFSTLDPGHRRSLEGFGAEDTVTYATAPNPNRRGLFLLTRTQLSSLLTTAGGLTAANATVILADNLLSLHFSYFDGNIWGESWNSESLPPGRQIPEAVAIELALASPNGAPLRLSTMVTLPMAFAQW
ncbi:MAG TPA: prepilin-type N-terminal cleavage/methylation domain-containing protein [Candidatus Binataceae bacterium]|nr:prepilin-type N-terminal cleavage/methylation domain-containing protein [Candidatus Binataceae bacterium]